ncbi:MAG: hypothetical protein JWM11_7812 [Planctomycetaceae bacterium]|nr:hypothetical protein [Planctomycetaceae bacterium]
MFSASKSWAGLFCAGIVLIHLSGCGSAPTTLERSGSLAGTVTFKGQPVEEGIVQISDSKVGGGGSGAIGAGGTFEIKGLLAGKYKVTIQPPTTEDRGDGKTAPRTVPKVVANIPEKYRSDATSGFTVDILDGEKTVAAFKMD